MTTDLETSQALREELQAQGHMYQWPYKGPDGFDQATVYRYCVDTSHPEVARWQEVRRSMKGVPTHKKLEILYEWYYSWTESCEDGTHISHSCIVQVYNYLGALRRGGQLNDANQIRKYI